MAKTLLIAYLIIITLPPVTASLLHRHQSPVMAASWSEVEMVYYRHFPDASRHYYRSVEECTLLYKWIKKDRLKIPDALRCTEHINLLMPTSAIKTWKQEKKQQSYINSHINSHNRKTAESYKNLTASAHIISIKPVTVSSQKLITGKDKKMVTGLFMQHVVNVRRYTFKDITTGKTGAINATANHPFYVKNRSAFIPIEKITGSDNLITETGQSVKLICPKNRKNHCGVAYGGDQPRPVYNLQIAHRHTYFVGKNYKILVHNCTKKRRLPIQAKRKAGDQLPNPELVPYQNGGNCTSIATCAVLQEARHWYDVPDHVILDSYQSYAKEGGTIDFTQRALYRAGIKQQYFSERFGAEPDGDLSTKLTCRDLAADLRRTKTELARVTMRNPSHAYMVIRSDDSPTGYLALNRYSCYSRKKMKYRVLPNGTRYTAFIKIRPKYNCH